MDEHKKFLADRLLSEERPITYRVLSRALDVHVNTAKEMLYDFYKYQNALRPDSVHATYLVCGPKASDIQPDGDVEMSSSMPEHDSFSDTVPTITVTVAKEENLAATLAQYQQVTSIHVYSLAPHPQKDLSLLVDVAKAISEYPTNDDDDAALSKKFGTIYNPHVRRRARKGRAAAPAAATAPSKQIKQEPAPAKAAPVKSEPAPSAPLKKESSSTSAAEQTPSSSSAKSTPAPKKGAAGGGLAAAFAKAKPPKPKPAVKKEEENAMALSDDGEAGDDDMPMPKNETPVDSESVRRTKKQREEDLRRMMEEDDQEEEDEEKEPEDEEMEEPEPEPVQEPEPEVKEEKKEPDEVVASSGDGRRRGKRRVMRKKRILDDQGYMVTIQEPGWESFSEDEALPAAAKKATPTSTPSSSAAKPKKSSAKGSQGSIMSFFGKK